MGLTSRDGIYLQEAIHTAKEIDQKNKLSGFNRHALDQMVLQGYGNAQFEISGEERLEIAEKFYPKEEAPQQEQGVSVVKYIHYELQQSFLGGL